MLRYTLANRPRSLGQVSLASLRLGQTPNAIATAKAADDAGQPVPEFRFVAYSGDHNYGYMETDSNGIASWSVPQGSGTLVHIFPSLIQREEIYKKYEGLGPNDKQKSKLVTSTSPPGPAPIIFTFTRKNVLQPTSDSQGSRSSTSPGSTPWVPIGIGLAVVAALGASEIFGLTNLLGLKK